MCSNDRAEQNGISRCWRKPTNNLVEIASITLFFFGFKRRLFRCLSSVTTIKICFCSVNLPQFCLLLPFTHPPTVALKHNLRPKHEENECDFINQKVSLTLRHFIYGSCDY
uniref:(northern house mosquito) hypothetical protein n=1 Tax=Culex pipiens TaxID=7175 RepID=A0A8D8F2W4_CULPI